MLGLLSLTWFPTCHLEMQDREDTELQWESLVQGGGRPSPRSPASGRGGWGWLPHHRATASRNQQGMKPGLSQLTCHTPGPAQDCSWCGG